MPEEVRRLLELQTLDRKVRELEESLSGIAGRISQLRENIGKHEAELERLSKEEQEAAATRKKLERELAEGEARLRNKRMRQNLIRNEKELQALSHEVETLKENNQRLEADLLLMMEGAQPGAERIKELGEVLSASRAELVAAEKEVASQLEELKGEIARLRRERAKLASEIDRPLLQRYEVIFARRQGLAVALAKSGTCQGCMRLLPPQLFNEIQRHSQIHFCPNCQRILSFEG